MSDAIASAAIGAGSALLGGILGYKSNKKTNATNLQIARETNENEYRMFQEGNEFNRQMAEYQNMWNSAAEQRKRLEEAGFNPASLFGNNQVPAASASSVSPPVLQRAEMRPFDPSPYLALFGQNVSAFAQAQKDLADARGVEINNQFIAENAKAQINELVARKLLTQSQADEIQQSIAFKDANWNALSQQINAAALESFNRGRQEVVKADIAEKYGVDMAEQEKQKLVSEVALLLEQGETEKAHQRLMRIQGDMEKARTVIADFAAHSLAGLQLSQVKNLNASTEYQNLQNEVFRLFGKGKAATEFMDAVMRSDITRIAHDLMDAKLAWKDIDAFVKAVSPFIQGGFTLGSASILSK